MDSHPSPTPIKSYRAKTRNEILNRSVTRIELPALPFAKDALSPHVSAETIEYHYGKHHQAYVSNLNQLIPGTKYENLPLEDVVRSSEGKIFNNAAQVWNYTFYWNCLCPNAAAKPAGALLQHIERQFGSFEQFQTQFAEASVGLFGSGWVWLIQTPELSNYGPRATPQPRRPRRISPY